RYQSRDRMGQRFMHGVARIGRESGKSFGPREDCVHGAEHVRTGAEGMAEAHVAKFMFGGFGQLLERVMHDRELARCCALEGEDRLLLVADREDRAPDRARAGTGEKFGGGAGGEGPMLWGCIL